MKTFFKIAGGVVLAVVALITIGVIWLMAKKPASRPASTEKVQANAASTSSNMFPTVSDAIPITSTRSASR